MMEDRKNNIRMLFLIALLAFNMRAGFTCVGTIIKLIQSDLGLTTAQAGMISSVPLIVFAALCPVSAPLARKFGIGRMVEAGLVLLTAGIILRGFFGAFGMFAGTAVLATGIAFMNALVISLIKLKYPGASGTATSIYTLSMAVGSVLSISICVPVTNVVGWRRSLWMWAILSLLGVVLWGTQAFRKENQGSSAAAVSSGLTGRLLRAPKTWILSAFMGTQSMLFYSIAAWIPTIIQSKGQSPETAALMSAVLQIVSLPPNFIIPIMAERVNRIRLILLFDIAYIIGGVIFFLADGGALLWIGLLLLSTGLGSGFSFSFFLFAKLTRTPEETSALSGLAQSIGYILAAVGPILMGGLFDRTGSWSLPMVFCFVMMIVMTAFSVLSARRGYVLND